MTESSAYLITQRYLNPDGSAEQHGGLQRYARELSRLLASHGKACTIIQRAKADFERQIAPEVNVVGLRPLDGARGNATFNHRAHRLIPHDAPVIYCVMEYTFPHIRKRSVAIQHGIWWDGRYSSLKQLVIRALNRRVLRKAQGVLCVDTNYINWCLSTFKDESLVISKCHYVPNFADPEQFPHGPLPAVKSTDGLPVVLCPRRCEEKRGVGLLFEACLRLWKSGERFRVVFCGKGDMQDHLARVAVQSGFTGLVEITDVPFDEMPKMYQRADIVVIPTLRHEGTSLSCIEALHMGKPVVTTYIGGLPNIVIPGFNGEMVPPAVEPMAEAMRRLLRDPKLRSTYGEKAAYMGQSLGIDRWRSAVWTLLQLCLFDGAAQTGREAVLAS